MMQTQSRGRKWIAAFAELTVVAPSTRAQAGNSCYVVRMHLRIETEREDDGRWLAEVPELPGVLAYGATAEEASARAEILALRVLAERLEHGESKPIDISISLATV